MRFFNKVTTMRLMPVLLAAAALLPAPAIAATRVERVVMLMRHGVRAPIEGEVPAGTLAAAPWPRWPVAPEQITPHGADALGIRGRADRAWLAAAGVLPATGCPAAGTVRVHSNVSQRTIDSGTAYIAGLAPGCDLTVDHLAPGQVDPLFEALRAHTTDFSGPAAVAAINDFTGGMDRLVARHRTELRLLDRVLACGQPTCSPGEPAALRATADGRGIDLTGPIRRTSGIAQVLLLEYAEGMPARVAPATLERLGRLHAALFDVFTRSPYMAAHQAGPLGRHILASLTALDGPALDLLIGHDTNVTALAGLLRVDLVAKGYAPNDTAPGGALALERVRDTVTGQRGVRLSYRTQSPTALRTLAPGVDSVRLAIPGCTTTPAAICPLDRFVTLLSGRLAPPLNTVR